VDDHDHVCRQLRRLIELRQGWVVCCEAVNGKEAVEKHCRDAHVTLMDFNMPGMDGLKASRVCQPMFSCSRVQVLSHNPTVKFRKADFSRNSTEHDRIAESAVEFVNYGDVRVDFDGASIEQSGFVTPLAHGIESGLIKQGVAFEGLQRANCAVGADEGVEFDAAFAAGLTGQRGENGLHAMNEHGRVDVCDVHDPGCGDVWNSRTGAGINGKSDTFGALWTDAVADRI